MRALLFLLLLLCAGCGASGGTLTAPTSGPPSAPTGAPVGTKAVSSKGDLSAGSVVNNLAVVLNAGWNAVGFQSQVVSALNATSSVAGLSTWNGTGYVTGNLDLATINAGAGARRGFWIFANQATSFTYSGVDDGQGNFVTLNIPGYQLVSFCSSVDVPGSSLTAVQNGQTVPLGSVVLPQFFEVGPTGQYTVVDVQNGGVLKPGKAYWVFANVAAGAIRLNFNPLNPTASPSPAASPVASASPDASPAASASPGASPTASPASATAVASSLLISTPAPTAGVATTATVTVLDQFGRTFIASPVTVSVALNTSPPGATLTTSPTATVNGQATVPITFTKVGANYSLRASAAGLTSANSQGFTVAAGAAKSLGFIVQPPAGTSGMALGNFQVGFVDAQGNVRTNSGGAATVTLAVASGPGTIGGTTARAIAGGASNVTFNDITLSTAGNYTLSASVTAGGPGGVTGTVSQTFSVATAVGGGLKLVFTAPSLPQTVSAGSTVPFTVQVQDAANMLQTGRTDAITVTLASNPAPNPVPATLAPGVTQLTANAVGGQATFNVSPNLAGAYTFQASAAGFTAVTSGTLTLGAGPAASMLFTGQPANNVVTNNVAAAITILDSQGNVKTDATGPVTITANSGIGVVYNTATPAIATPNIVVPAAGVATAAVRIPIAQPAFSLKATYGGSDTVAGGVAVVASNPIILRGELLTNNGFIGAPGTALTITDASLSDTGQFEAFVDPTASQVYVRDRYTGTVTLASAQDNTAGVTANAACSQPRISDDGKTVVFQTAATNLIPGYTGATTNVYLRRVDTNRTLLVSRTGATATAAGDFNSGNAFVSKDGTRVGFQSLATNLGVTGNGQQQIFSSSITGTTPPTVGGTVLASVNTTTSANASAACILTGMSSDGLNLVYETTSNNLGGPALAGGATSRIYRSLITSANAVSAVTPVALSLIATPANPTISDTGLVCWRAVRDPITGSALATPAIYTFTLGTAQYQTYSAALVAAVTVPVIDRTGAFVAYFQNAMTRTLVLRLSDNTVRPNLGLQGTTNLRASLTSGSAWIGYYQGTNFVAEPGP